MPDSPRDSHAILRRHIARIGVDAFAAHNRLNPRTAQRIYSGAHRCPPRILRGILELEAGA